MRVFYILIIGGTFKSKVFQAELKALENEGLDMKTYQLAFNHRKYEVKELREVEETLKRLRENIYNGKLPIRAEESDIPSEIDVVMIYNAIRFAHKYNCLDLVKISEEFIQEGKHFTKNSRGKEIPTDELMEAMASLDLSRHETQYLNDNGIGLGDLHALELMMVSLQSFKKDKCIEKLRKISASFFELLMNHLTSGNPTLLSYMIDKL